jgi:RNA polymerase sigma-70 factor (ECF subfamily)
VKWKRQKNNPSLSDPDNQLMLRTGSGDTGAFKLLMEKHRVPVMRLIYRYTGMHHEAEDLAQDIFLKIYRTAGNYIPRAQFHTWLYKVVTNHCLNFHRSQKKHKYDRPLDPSLSETDIADQSSDGAGPEAAAETRLRQEALTAAVQTALDRLPDRQRMAVILFRFEGLSYSEIAQALGCSVSAVESLIFRAMNTLRELLKPYKKPEGSQANGGTSGR